MKPEPPSGIRYDWKASSGSCSVSAPFSSTTRVNASSRGTCSITLVVTDKEGITLGTGAASFQVTTSKETVEADKARLQAYEKARQYLATARTAWQAGKREEALEGARKALDIMPDFSEARSQLTKWEAAYEKEQERYNDLIAEARAAETRKAYREAISAYEKAQTIRADQAIASRIAELKEEIKRQEDQEAAFQDLVTRGYGAEKKNALEEALDLYTRALEIKKDTKVEQRINELHNRIAELKRQEEADRRFAELLSRGYAAEQRTDYPQAIARYQEALKIRKDQKVEQHIRELQDVIARQQEQDNRSTH